MGVFNFNENKYSFLKKEKMHAEQQHLLWGLAHGAYQTHLLSCIELHCDTARAHCSSPNLARLRIRFSEASMGFFSLRNSLGGNLREGWSQSPKSSQHLVLPDSAHQSENCRNGCRAVATGTQELGSWSLGRDWRSHVFQPTLPSIQHTITESYY